MSKYMRQFEIIAQLRGLQDLVFKEEEKMAITYDINKDLRFKQGLKVGETKGKLSGKKVGEKRGEKIGEKRGLLKSIDLMLDFKFGKKGLKILNKIKKIDDIEKLEYIMSNLNTAGSVSEIEDLL